MKIPTCRKKPNWNIMVKLSVTSRPEDNTHMVWSLKVYIAYMMMKRAFMRH